MIQKRRLSREESTHGFVQLWTVVSEIQFTTTLPHELPGYPVEMIQKTLYNSSLIHLRIHHMSQRMTREQVPTDQRQIQHQHHLMTEIPPRNQFVQGK